MDFFDTLTLTGNTAGPHLLVSAGVHGDEPEAVQAVRDLAGSIDVDMLAGTLTLVPVVNESAVKRNTRRGEDELDLARTFPGRPDGSITERVANEFAKRIRLADFFVDLHTGGRLLRIEPLVGYMLVSDRSVLEAQRRMAKAFGLSLIWGTSAQLDGRSLSVARDAGVPAIYAEYLGGDSFSPAAVDAYVSGCLGVMREIGMLKQAKLLDRQKRVCVEDDRPSSGHLQIQHPSVAAGRFIPSVTLGEWVQAGQEIGGIIETASDQRIKIFAEKPGRIIALPGVPYVKKDDCLAVIMDLSDQFEL